MRTVLTILVAGLLVFGATGVATAQDGARFGMGVELMNQPTFIGISYYFDEFDFDASLDYDWGTTQMTPAVLFTIQATPAVFIEPYVGYHRMSMSEEVSGSGKVEMSGHDLLFGAGLIYALKPDATVSPILHPIVDVHLISATVEATGTGEDGKLEVSSTAFSVGLGIGGLVNIKDGLFFTAEARLKYMSVGDSDVTVEPADGFTDDVDTSESLFDTDMVVGVRFVF